MKARASLLVAGIVVSVSAAPGPQTFTGVITDDMCGKVGHSRMRMGSNDAECTTLCVSDHDASYILLDGTKIYSLSDQRTPQKFAGTKVKIVGTLDSTSKTIHVESISTAK